MNIGENIRLYRKNCALSQQDVAGALDVSVHTVNGWESNEHKPTLDKLERLAEFFGISAAKLVDYKGADHHRWELHDRMFAEERMSNFVRTAASDKGLAQTLDALEFSFKAHEGQIRKGKEAVPYIYHPLMIACHALALGLDDDEIIATALLHDTVEDCNVALEDLPVSDTVREAVDILTFRKLSGKTKEESKQAYYDRISQNRLATIVKVLDRCNNISSMAVGFESNAKMAGYIDETEKYVMPVLDVMKHRYPECYNASFILKYHIKSVLESLKRLI